MSEQQPVPASGEKTFVVKLYHPIEENVHCVFRGQSVRLNLKATDKTKLREIIETQDNGFFKGDSCKKCGTLARVTIE